jgi:hypothetical protein
MLSLRILIFFTSVAFAAKTGRSILKVGAISLIKNNAFFSPNVLLSPENIKEEDLVDATRLIQKSFELINGCDTDLENDHFSCSRRLPIPPIGDSNTPVVTVQIGDNPFSASYFHSGGVLNCVIIDADGRQVTLLAFTDSQRYQEETAAIHALMQIILTPHGWPLEATTLPKTVPRLIFGGKSSI